MGDRGEVRGRGGRMGDRGEVRGRDGRMGDRGGVSGGRMWEVDREEVRG